MSAKAARNSTSLARPFVIGLAGGTGSGKTTVAEAIVNAAGEAHAALLPQDAYYRATPDLPFEVRKLTNYDQPDAFDNDLLVSHLDDLLRGKDVPRPIYDFANYDRSDGVVWVKPCAVVIVEGVLVLHDADLRKRLDLAIFVDAPPDERFIRRLERDVSERGRSAESVIKQYRRTVKPMHDLFVEPTKQHADLIIPTGANNQMALQVLSTFVASVTQR